VAGKVITMNLLTGKNSSNLDSGKRIFNSSKINKALYLNSSSNKWDRLRYHRIKDRWTNSKPSNN